jgi:hypothetical protein
VKKKNALKSLPYKEDLTGNSSLTWRYSNKNKAHPVHSETKESRKKLKEKDAKDYRAAVLGQLVDTLGARSPPSSLQKSHHHHHLTKKEIRNFYLSMM